MKNYCANCKNSDPSANIHVRYCRRYGTIVDKTDSCDKFSDYFGSEL